MVQDSSNYWKKSRVEMRAAGFDPDKTVKTNAVVTIASAYTNAHRCNNRVRTITDLLVELLAEKGGQGLIDGGLQPSVTRRGGGLLRDRPLRPSWRRDDRDLRL